MKKHRNCVFVGFTEGKSAFVFQRGTIDRNGSGFKGDVSGSDKSVAFSLPADPAKNTVHVFESPTDLMSYQTLHRNLTSNAVALNTFRYTLETAKKVGQSILNFRHGSQ